MIDGNADGDAAASLLERRWFAFADHGEGFCVLDDVAVAISKLRTERALERAVVIDLDLHHGNGTAAIFEADDEVLTFSMARTQLSAQENALESGPGHAGPRGRRRISRRTAAASARGSPSRRRHNVLPRGLGRRRRPAARPGAVDRLSGTREAGEELGRRDHQPFELADGIGLDLAHALGGNAVLVRKLVQGGFVVGHPAPLQDVAAALIELL